MKKLSFALVLTCIMSIGMAYNVEAATASNNVVAKNTESAASGSEGAVASAEQEAVDAIMVKIEAAVQAGDKKLVTKLLAAAVKSNPKLASKIVAAFVATSAKAEGSNSGSTAAAIDVGAVVSDVANSLQGQKGAEEIAAAVLSAYTPAAGNKGPSSAANPASGNTAARVPPARPRSDRANIPAVLPAENPNQSSGR